MPLNLQKNLPAVELLKKEHIFVMDSLRASAQDIRPLRVVVLNLISARSAKYRQEHAGEPTVSDKVKEKWENHVRVREDKKAAKLLAKEEKKQEKLAQKQQDEQNKQD